MDELTRDLLEDRAVEALDEAMQEVDDDGSSNIRAAVALRFIADALHGDGDDADAIREALGLRVERRHLCLCGGDLSGFGHFMASQHKDLEPERRVVGEWQEATA